MSTPKEKVVKPEVQEVLDALEEGRKTFRRLYEDRDRTKVSVEGVQVSFKDLKPYVGRAIMEECCRSLLDAHPNPDELLDGEMLACSQCGRIWMVTPNYDEGKSWKSDNREPQISYGGQ